MAIFEYGEKEINYLKSKDKRLAAVIERIGHLDRETDPDLFYALSSSIAAQQVSGKAAETVWRRVTEKTAITPESIAALDAVELQSCGLSMRKVQYIKEAAEKILAGELDLDATAKMSDEEVITELVKLRGIGRWTAEMLLIFSLGRPDVLSFGDFAIKKGLKLLYGHKEITKELFEKYRRRYSPFCSVASFYLWAMAGGE